MTDFEDISERGVLEEKGIDVAKPGDEDYRSPNVGGCWVCCRDAKGEEFSMEFDTWYHQDCLDDLGVDSIIEYEREY